MPPDAPDVTGGGWSRLNARMLLVHPVRELVRLFPALIGVTVAGSGRDGGWIGPAFAALLILYGIARWFTTTYRVTPDRVQVRSGVFSRKTLTVTRDRLRSADVTANVLHRALGLARLEVGTGRADKAARLRLDALGTHEAARLREELLRDATPRPAPARGPAEGALPGPNGRAGPAEGALPGPHDRAGPAEGAMPGPHDRVEGGIPPSAPVVSSDVAVVTELARVRPAWLAYAPFTLSGVVTLGVILGFGAQFVNEADLGRRAGGSIDAAGGVLDGIAVWVLVVLVVVAVLLLVSVLSIAGYTLAYWNFRLTRDAAGTLSITRGLLTTRQTTLAERRLRGAEIHEPLLLRTVGGAAVLAVAVGLSRRGDSERGGAMALPPAPRAEAHRVAAAVAGTAEPFTGPLAAHGPRATRRRYSRALAPPAVLAAVLALLAAVTTFPAWPATVALAFALLAVPLAADRARSLGHAVVAGHLVTRSGSLVRRRSALRTEGIIGITISRTFFQRRAGVATLIATTAAGRKAYAALDVTPETAVKTARTAVPGLLEPFLEEAVTPGR